MFVVRMQYIWALQQELRISPESLGSVYRDCLCYMVSDHELLKLLLPEFLVERFDILKAENYHAELQTYCEERTDSYEFKERLLGAKSFLPEIIVDDYPLRSKIVKLHVKRRKRTGQSSGEILQREWQLVARGTRMTKYLVGFLKKIADTKALPFNFCA